MDRLDEVFVRHLRCYDLFFDEKDVICLTNTVVPNYVKFIVSLGKKFAYMPGTNTELGCDFGFFLRSAQLYAEEEGQIQL